MKTLFGFTAFLLVVTLVSCENNPSRVRKASGPPTLSHVSLIDKDSTTSQGTRGQQYLLIGKNLESTQSVTFNGEPAEVNLAFATDHNLIVAVPDSTPFRNAKDSLTVTNSAGNASIYFHITQPPPTVKNFSPKSGGAGATVTVRGTVFDGIDSVLFGNEETGKPAQILSSTNNQVKVKVPEGIVSSPITVITPGGSNTSSTNFSAFSYLVYGDKLHANWDSTQSYSGTATFHNTQHVYDGSFAAKMVYSAGYGGFKVYNNGTAPSLADKETITLAIYTDQTNETVQLVLNGDYDNTKALQLSQGEYVKFTVPLSEVGSPSNLQIITLQEYSGNAATIFIDNIGVI